MDRRELLKGIAASAGLILYEFNIVHSETDKLGDASFEYDPKKYNWGYGIDIDKCIGCHKCLNACQDENNLPKTEFRTWIEEYVIHSPGQVAIALSSLNKPDRVPDKQYKKAFFLPRICNHCDNPACLRHCPTRSIFKTLDHLVLVNSNHCIGCGYCKQTCPYGMITIHSNLHVADKCTLCYHRIIRGGIPACVLACPTGARMFGNLNDPQSAIRKHLDSREYGYLRKQFGTNPRCLYFGPYWEVI